VLARLVGAELVVADDGQLSFVFEDQAALTLTLTLTLSLTLP
tara:strand:- start:329 stop:454 length:126 start_codon:yes stop_codon:yes gene_type:complete